MVPRLLATVSEELVDGEARDGEAGYPGHNDHHRIHPVGICDLLHFGEFLLGRDSQITDGEKSLQSL